MSILQDIYNEAYSPIDKADKLPFSLRLTERAFYEAVEEAMGAEFVDKQREKLCKVENFRDFANFREGFRLGVSLMLELL